MSKLPLNYIAGCIDCDGSFSISVIERTNKKYYQVEIRPVVNFSQLAKYRSVLEGIRDTLGAGRIYKRPGSNSDMPMLTWQTVAVGESLMVAEKLYGYLHIKKDICGRFIEATRLWIESKKKVSYQDRFSGKLCRPVSVVLRVAKIGLTLNENGQTRKTYERKYRKYLSIKRRLEKDYLLMSSEEAIQCHKIL